MYYLLILLTPNAILMCMSQESLLQDFTDAIRHHNPDKASGLINKCGTAYLEKDKTVAHSLIMTAAKHNQKKILDALIESETIFANLGPLGAQELCYYASLNGYDDVFRKILLNRKKLGLTAADEYNMLFLRFIVRNDKKHFAQLLSQKSACRAITVETLINGLGCAASRGLSTVIGITLDNDIIVKKLTFEIIKQTLEVAVKSDNDLAIVKILNAEKIQNYLTAGSIKEFFQKADARTAQYFNNWLKKNGFL